MVSKVMRVEKQMERAPKGREENFGGGGYLDLVYI